MLGNSQVQYSSCYHPGLNSRCSRSFGFDPTGGFLERGELVSPTTFYPCERRHPSPDSLCVFRRQLESPEETTPSIRRLAWQARSFHGSPPPAPKPMCDAASLEQLVVHFVNTYQVILTSPGDETAAVVRICRRRAGKSTCHGLTKRSTSLL